MDFKNLDNKDKLLKNISTLCNGYESDLKALVSDPQTYKRAALLYYWLRDYRNYLKNEPMFSPRYCPSFERGNVVNLNLGFNLGSEMGGLHYGVVLANSNRKNPNLIVVPMTSVKPGNSLEHLRPSEVYLGEELYHMIQGKFRALQISMTSEAKLMAKLIEESRDNPEARKRLEARTEKLGKQTDLLSKTYRKLHVLKKGSIVEINQIRTVSKMRIVDPMNEYDILYGLKVSRQYLDKIDNTIIRTLTGK